MSSEFFERFWLKVDKSGGDDACWIWQAYIRGGYGCVRLSKPRRLVYAHRIAFELTYGPIPLGFCVCHTCDNPLCVNPKHLWLGTLSDNTRDAVRKGRWWSDRYPEEALKRGKIMNAARWG